ncbi:MAG: hypothetical protein AB9907_17855 [Flexilinea sp.]
MPGLIIMNKAFPNTSEQSHVNIALDQNTIREVGYRSMMPLSVQKAQAVILQDDLTNLLFIVLYKLMIKKSQLKYIFRQAILVERARRTELRSFKTCTQEKHALDLAFQNPIQITIKGLFPKVEKTEPPDRLHLSSFS